jgi:RimJ/RimL family protein N-acetyltransferase
MGRAITLWNWFIGSNQEYLFIMVLSTFFYGSRVRLAPLTPNDVPVLARWQLDSEYLRLLAAEPAFPKTEGQVAEWVRDGQRGRDNYLLGIRTLNDDELIGFIELGEILWTHRNSWLAIGIGERGYWGRGYGYEAMGLVLDFAFKELNLHRIQLTVYTYNERAIRMYEKLGFQREGSYREFLLRDGQYYDMLLYGLLSHEWLGSKNI